MLRLTNVGKAYGPPTQPIPVLKDVSFSIPRGAFCAVLGPSGSGKSTLLNIVGLLDKPDTGQLMLDDIVVDYSSARDAARLRNAMLGFVFQSFQLLPRLSAWQNVALPLLYRGIPRERRKAAALTMLDRVGLADRSHHHPTELSGGQRQRVALARALIGEPSLILADEPTGSLDSVTAVEVMELLRHLNRSLEVTILMVTHDRDLAAQCDRQIEFLDGRIVSDSLSPAAKRPMTA
ncbi:ABC transporter ATP-binding protein [Sphingomonas sp. So64.6b]|uniref:ABC transporter ATP-binding protein n=1 Tax=Sphingomonas sp. So64.6b TaxID=2997354 RepID=UPI001603512C|nr:ABC transporter ATP-binding protein [Sphingomonas sp. So64.6b]QNA82616.1 ABC transporter ATP-binding protein [Sphingomonas sp. So64.6b]